MKFSLVIKKNFLIIENPTWTRETHRSNGLRKHNWFSQSDQNNIKVGHQLIFFSFIFFKFWMRWIHKLPILWCHYGLWMDRCTNGLLVANRAK